MSEPTHILAIDPGPEQSAWIIWTGAEIVGMNLEDNATIRSRLLRAGSNFVPKPSTVFVIERMQCFGMPVGQSVMDTEFWAGRFWECASTMKRCALHRKDVKLHLCQSARAKDANVRQALIDRFGPVGVKSGPGILYGVKKDLWSALALAVTYQELKEQESPALPHQKKTETQHKENNQAAGRG